MFLMPNYENKIKNVITLSTPHQNPNSFDRGMHELYEELNSFWRNDNDIFNDVILVSIAVGTRDIILDSELTLIDGFYSDQKSLHIDSIGAPHIWTSTDHEGNFMS
jgi:hypothetical protein